MQPRKDLGFITMSPLRPDAMQGRDAMLRSIALREAAALHVGYLCCDSNVPNLLHGSGYYKGLNSTIKIRLVRRPLSCADACQQAAYAIL